MDFDNKLKEDLKQQIISSARQNLKINLEDYESALPSSHTNKWDKILIFIKDFIRDYMEKNTDLSAEQITELIDKFSQSVSDEALILAGHEIELTDDEERYIMYDDTKYYSYDKINAISEILLRRKLIEFWDEYIGNMKTRDALEKAPVGELQETSISDELERAPVVELSTILSKDHQTKEGQYLYELISGQIFKSEKEWEELVKEKAERCFNQEINCGGYALELDTCIYHYSKDFEKSVSELLDKVPFVRLLGDKKLADDEYLALWRAKEGGGHHFIKILDDGTIMEKYGCNPVRAFSGWSERFQACPEAVLAVKKEHDIYLASKNSSISIDGKKAMNFEETVQQAIQNQNNSFEYHNHEFYLKKGESGKIYICSAERVVADALLQSESCFVNIIDKRYVSNIQPPVPLKIKDGKLQKNNDEIEK